MKAVVTGVTGLIGSAVGRQLAADPQFTEVLLLARRPSAEPWPAHVEWRVVDFDAADTYTKLGAPDVVFSCFGTTRKQSKTEAAYRRVDYDYPLAIAKAAPKAHYLVVTAAGADAGSKMYYTRLKGQLEDSLRGLPLPGLDIFQPGMLLGRAAGERAFEGLLGAVFQCVDLLLLGPLKKYHSISGAQVAQAMIRAAKARLRGVRVHRYTDMVRTSALVHYHGTRADLKVGDQIVPGHNSNFGTRKTSKYIYFSGTLDAATWGAELAQGEGPGRIYQVEPTGGFEDDPNLTDKKFPGNPTLSYRSALPLRVTVEVVDWQGHSPEAVQTMKDRVKAIGLDPIED